MTTTDDTDTETATPPARDFGSHLDTAWRAWNLARLFHYRHPVDKDIARAAGMDGNAATIMQAARLLDERERGLDRLADFVRPADLEEARAV